MMEAKNMVVVICTRDEAQKLLDTIDKVQDRSLKDRKDFPNIQDLMKLADVLTEAFSTE